MGTSNGTQVEERKSNTFPSKTDLSHEAVGVSALQPLLAHAFALYLKTKNFHWHMRGRYFREYHLLLDEQGAQAFAMMDAIDERARKLGGATLHSISDIARHQFLQDNNNADVTPQGMLAELYTHNQQLTRFLRPRIRSASSMTMSPRPAYLRPGLTKRSAESGSYRRSRAISQVMGLVMTRWLNKHIAAELGTSEITIKLHRQQNMHKMQAEKPLQPFGERICAVHALKGRPSHHRGPQETELYTVPLKAWEAAAELAKIEEACLA